jgi:hypothetical protein
MFQTGLSTSILAWKDLKLGCRLAQHGGWNAFLNAAKYSTNKVLPSLKAEATVNMTPTRLASGIVTFDISAPARNWATDSGHSKLSGIFQVNAAATTVKGTPMHHCISAIPTAAKWSKVNGGMQPKAITRGEERTIRYSPTSFGSQLRTPCLSPDSTQYNKRWV